MPQTYGRWHREVSYYVYEAGGNLVAVYLDSCGHDILTPSEAINVDQALDDCEGLIIPDPELPPQPPTQWPGLRLIEWMVYGDAATGRIASVKPAGGIPRSLRGMRSDETSSGVGATERAAAITGATPNIYATRTLGEKLYELKDHLGNGERGLGNGDRGCRGASCRNP